MAVFEKQTFWSWVVVKCARFLGGVICFLGGFLVSSSGTGTYAFSVFAFLLILGLWGFWGSYWSVGVFLLILGLLGGLFWSVGF